MDLSDEELIARIRAGEPGAADQLFGRYPQFLRGLARRALGGDLSDKVGESDVVQDARLTAFRRLGDFEDRGEGSFRRWLAGIVERKASEERRRFRSAKRSCDREVRGAAAEVSTSGSAPTPSVVAIASERREQLMRSIESLAPAYRAVIRHVDLSGLTFAQTAERMDRTPEAARKLYARAVASLTVELRKNDRDAP